MTVCKHIIELTGITVRRKLPRALTPAGAEYLLNAPPDARVTRARPPMTPKDNLKQKVID